jgi:hypothetical protein
MPRTDPPTERRPRGGGVAQPTCELPLLIGADGWGRLDVRAQIETDDGALLYVTYDGVLELTGQVMTATQTMAEEIGFDDQYVRTTPRLEAGDPRYAWVNQTVFVGRGRLIPGGVEYEVYRAT